MVKEPVQHQGYKPQDIPQVETPPPLRDRIVEEGPRDYRTKDGKGKRREQDEGAYHPPILVGHELSHDDVERQLACSCHAVADVRRDERFDGLRA